MFPGTPLPWHILSKVTFGILLLLAFTQLHLCMIMYAYRVYLCFEWLEEKHGEGNHNRLSFIGVESILKSSCFMLSSCEKKVFFNKYLGCLDDSFLID